MTDGQIAGGGAADPNPNKQSIGESIKSSPLLRKWWFWVITAVLLLGVISAVSGGDSQTNASKKRVAVSTTIKTPRSTLPVETTPPTTAPPVTSPPPTAPPVTTPPPPVETTSQSNAVQKAQEYLDYQAFSRSGLIDQLVFEGFSTEDATYGVDAVSPDWNDQAAKKAAEYLDYESFSHSGLVEQLVFEGFTPEQAEYGVSTTGL
jgi:hypothetical protein